MSAIRDPTALAAIAVMGNAQPPNPPHPSNNHPPSAQHPHLQPTTGVNRRPLPPHVNVEHLRFVERRAREEIKIIEENARVAARKQHPLEPLPRTESNVRSVKRTRQWRKQVEQILKDKIIQKVERNRELDRLIEIEKSKHRRFTQQQPPSHGNVPQPQQHLVPQPYLVDQPSVVQDHEQRLVQVDEVTADQLMNDFVARMEADHPVSTPQHQTDHPLPDQDFDQTFSDLAGSLIDRQPFDDTADEDNQLLPGCEPTLNPKFLMGVHLLEDFDARFLLDEADPTL